MKNIDDFNFRNRKALLRVDFNVPLNNELIVTDETRIIATIPTIKKIINEGGSVILMSHLGRPKKGPEDQYSLKHIIPNLQEKLGTEVKFVQRLHWSISLRAITNTGNRRSNAPRKCQILPRRDQR